MAITVNNIATPVVGKTISGYTPTSITDSMLIVVVTSEDVSNDDPITAVTHGSDSLTLAVHGEHLATSAQDADVWYRINPSTSSGDITVTGGNTGRTCVHAMTLGGVAQESPIDVTDTGTATFYNPHYGVDTEWTPTVDDWIAIHAACGDNESLNWTVQAGGTEASETGSGSSSTSWMAYEIGSGTSADTEQYSGTDLYSARAIMATAVIKAAAGGGGGRIMGGLAGLGGLAGSGGLPARGGGLAG